ncbi:condensin subunit ScpA [Marininema mesophilum]|uniref:Segregation and condensation protein A n=1 Tax=Marininema mesophilum TaxID=1048340 RepID=A0A1H2UJH1_9BACL|nr:segregation/condensation protein A [Marininema mesophilum]SDW56283.1 condensin subunit ScpA [Marininema mesophilum]
MDVKIKLDMFEGPLDLLLHLIDKAEVDVTEIPIAHITDQYMEVLSATQELQLDVASEFLVMAATLLAIKSRMLLPRAEPVELTDMFGDEEGGLDPREELIQRLLEYKRYKRLSDNLREWEESRSQVYTRLPMDLSPYAPTENPLQGVTPEDLLQYFVDALTNRVEKETDFTEMSREEISVSDRMEEIALRVLKEGGRLRFSQLLQWERLTKERVVTTFLAILELMKTHRVKIQQHHLFSDMEIEAKPAGGGPSIG